MLLIKTLLFQQIEFYRNNVDSSTENNAPPRNTLKYPPYVVPSIMLTDAQRPCSHSQGTRLQDIILCSLQDRDGTFQYPFSREYATLSCIDQHIAPNLPSPITGVLY